MQFDLEHRLSIFVREEISTWFTMSKAEPRANLRDYVLNAVDAVVRKAQVMSCKYERERVRHSISFALPRVYQLTRRSVQPASAVVPVTQSVLQLIISATSPINLSKAEPTLVPML